MSKTKHSVYKYVKNIKALTTNQQEFLNSLEENEILFLLGPAGSGKSYLTVSKAVEFLEKGKVSKIILTRPAIEAEENLGFLPGDMIEKLGPYLRPIYDILVSRIGVSRMKALIAEEVIEVAPLAYMRGRNIDNSFIILDEAQNCTYGQLKMMLTRIGKNSKLVINGDPEQIDLKNNYGILTTIAEKVSTISGISVVRLYKDDIVRNNIISKILEVI